MVEALDAGMKNFAEVIFHTTGKDISNHSGTGAAGGMGGSLLAFLNAKLKPGIQLMLETLDFSNKIKGADLIITGEGKADKQTLMGKVPSGILDKARKQKIPVILIAGSVENADDLHRAGFRGSIFYQSTIHNVGAGHATGSCTRKYLRNGGRDLSFLLKFIFQ